MDELALALATLPLNRSHADVIVYLFLGAAILTVGLVAAAIALLRRKFDPMLFWFSLFALLYGARLWWMQSGLLAALVPDGDLVPRLSKAIDYIVPIPAFYFFKAAGYLSRFSSILIIPLAITMLCLTITVLVIGPNPMLHAINSATVIASLLLLLSRALWREGQTQELRIVRFGLITFIVTALWDNIGGLKHFYLDVEPFGFVIFLATLGYVGARRTLHRETELSAVRAELSVAEEMQRSILPNAFPDSTDFRVAARYVPMRSVAGDFYDFLPTSDREAALLIADVSGHGVPAALIASMVKLAAASQRSNADDPAAFLTGMNDTLCGNTQNQFVTAAYVHLNAATAEMRYAAAAHPPMLLLRDGEVSEIVENGLMLGAFDTATYATVTHALQRGDRLLLYTDGVMEAANASREEFGRERLCALLREASPLSHDSTADLILSRVKQWSAAQEDDLTVLICDYQRD